MNWDAPRYVIIPTKGRDCLERCIAAVSTQVNDGVLVNTDPEKIPPYWEYDKVNAGFAIIDDIENEVNISRWWNQGLAWVEEDAAKHGYTEWDVAIINDDVIIPMDWYNVVAGSMRRGGVAAGCSGGTDNWPVVNREARQVPLQTRMQGFAFVLRGELRLRACEDIPWYGSDDYLDVQARLAGGVVMVPGYHVQHLHPNEYLMTTPGLVAASDRGMGVLMEKIGFHPFL